MTRGGTYLVMEGPQFSTKAESELYRSWGCSVIGMTNMPEAKLAREAELCYATVAMVTDFDCWHPDHDHVTVEAVVRVLLDNADKARALVQRVVPEIGRPRELCPAGCDRALDNAIITATPHARSGAGGEAGRRRRAGAVARTEQAIPGSSPSRCGRGEWEGRDQPGVTDLIRSSPRERARVLTARRLRVSWAAFATSSGLASAAAAPAPSFTAPSGCGTAIGATTTGVTPCLRMSSWSATFGVTSTTRPSTNGPRSSILHRRGLAVLQIGHLGRGAERQGLAGGDVGIRD